MKATPNESKATSRDSLMSSDIGSSHILRNSNSSRRFSQVSGSNLLKPVEALQDRRRKRDSKCVETENVMLSSLLADKKIRQSDPPKPFAAGSRVSRPVKQPVTAAVRRPSMSRMSRGDIQGVSSGSINKELDSKKRMWTR